MTITNFYILTSAAKETISVYETFLVRIRGLHRLEPEWAFDDYVVTAQVYHGTTPITNEAVATRWAGKSESFYERVKFDAW